MVREPCEVSGTKIKMKKMIVIHSVIHEGHNYDRRENGEWFLVKYVGTNDGQECYCWVPQQKERTEMLEYEYQKMILQEL